MYQPSFESRVAVFLCLVNVPCQRYIVDSMTVTKMIPGVPGLGHEYITSSPCTCRSSYVLKFEGINASSFTSFLISTPQLPYSM